jgi:hypothetical protein
VAVLLASLAALLVVMVVAAVVVSRLAIRVLPRVSVVAAMLLLKCAVRKVTTLFNLVLSLRRKLLMVLLTIIRPAVLVAVEMSTPVAMVLLPLLCLKHKDN